MGGGVPVPVDRGLRLQCTVGVPLRPRLNRIIACVGEGGQASAKAAGERLLRQIGRVTSLRLGRASILAAGEEPLCALQGQGMEAGGAIRVLGWTVIGSGSGMRRMS